MSDTITLIGNVSTPPRHSVTNGIDVTTFRLATNQGYYDREKREWVEAEANWFTVTAFRQLAKNSVQSLEKGQRVIVRGKLKVRPWNTGEKSGTNIDIDAQSIGHDLSRGFTRFTKVDAPASASGESGGPGDSAESVEPSGPGGRGRLADDGTDVPWGSLSSTEEVEGLEASYRASSSVDS